MSNYDPEAYKARREYWRKMGKCTNCGHDRDLPGQICSKCRAYSGKYRKKAYAKKKAEGRCVCCGKKLEPERKGKTLCGACTKRHQDANKIRSIKYYGRSNNNARA